MCVCVCACVCVCLYVCVKGASGREAERGVEDLREARQRKRWELGGGGAGRGVSSPQMIHRRTDTHWHASKAACYTAAPAVKYG